MSHGIGDILLAAFLPLALNTALYAAAFRIRRIKATFLNCVVIAGAPVIVGFVPIPLPAPLGFVVGLGAAIFLTAHYTEAELFPDAFLIPCVVQLLSALTLPFVLSLVL
jgi:hypothetical protein